MAEMRNQVEINNDEIDLIQVLERIIRFLSTYKRELIITAITGMICGYTIFRTLPKSYGSTLILHSQVLTNSEEIEIIGSWNNLLNNHEYSVLSRNLRCSENLLSKIKSMSATNIPSPVPGTSSGFTVYVLVKDTSILEDLQTGIIYGLENNEFVKEKVESKKSNTIKLIENITQEIGKLDSTKRRIESGNSRKSPGSSPLIMDISDVNVQMITLNEKLYANQEVLKFVDAIQVLQNFEKYAKPASPRFLTLVISGFFGGLFLGFALAVFKNLKLKISALHKARESRIPDKELV